jgi:preprotein translocase subunit SecG
MTLILGFFTVVLVLATVFMVLIILMQRPRSDSGLGAALGGGGAAESAFGAETGNILSKSTIYCAIFFFVASFGLYLGHMYASHRGPLEGRELPEIRGIGEPIAPIEPPGAPPLEETPLPPEEELAPAEEVPEEGTPPAPFEETPERNDP